MNINKNALMKLSNSMGDNFKAIQIATENIKKMLVEYADGKILKGDEIVGWFGEVCCRELTSGRMVSDNLEYDVVTAENNRISVKTRKGQQKNWNVTSIIPKIDINDESPTHLMFIHLKDDYSVKEIWLYPWEEIYKLGRFQEKKVRGEHRGYIFKVKVKEDEKYLVNI